VLPDQWVDSWRLTDEGKARLLAGEHGEPAGAGRSPTRSRSENSFDAADFVGVCRRPHIMARHRNRWVKPGSGFPRNPSPPAPEAERRVRVPTITDPRGIDFRGLSARLGADTRDGGARDQSDHRRCAPFGVLMDRYLHQLPDDHGADPRRAPGVWRYPGVVIYSNTGVPRRPQQLRGWPFGAGRRAGPDGPPRYGYHLDCCRRATRRFRLTGDPRANLSEWGALGGIVGEACGSYWEVPVIEGRRRNPRFRRAQAFRHGAGELWVGRPLPHARHHRRRKPSSRDPRRLLSPSAGTKSKFFPSARYAAAGDQARRCRLFAAPQFVAVRNGSNCLPPSMGAGCTPIRPCSSRLSPEIKTLPPTGWA